MEDEKDKTLAEIYQHVCDCQDLSESIGDWNLMDVFQKLRILIDRERFG